jgi:hypothetical protein
MQSSAFQDAMADFAQAEIAARVEYLRGCVRGNTPHDAALVEGEMSAFDGLAAALAQHAQQHAVDRAS